MMKWIKEHLVLVLIVLVAVLTGYVNHKLYGSKIARLKVENERLANNQQALLVQCDTLTLAGGKSLARVQQLELQKAELEALCQEQCQQIEELGIKTKYLEQVISTASHTSVHVDTLVRDSIIIVPVYVAGGTQYKQDTLQVWNWADDWVQASGTIDKEGRVQADFNSTDSLLIVAHRVPKRFLFFKYGTKYVELNVVSNNPHTRLFYAKSVKIQKK